jgi:hypothetical protein
MAHEEGDPLLVQATRQSPSHNTSIASAPLASRPEVHEMKPRTWGAFNDVQAQLAGWRLGAEC